MNTHWNCFYQWTLLVVCKNQHRRKKSLICQLNRYFNQLWTFWLKKMINFDFLRECFWLKTEHFEMNWSIRCNEISNKNPQLFFWTKNYCFKGETKIHLILTLFQNDENQTNTIFPNQSVCVQIRMKTNLKRTFIKSSTRQITETL